MLFDHIARQAFCHFVDLEDQQEIVRTFSRAQEKATWLDQKRTKVGICGLNALPQSNVIGHSNGCHFSVICIEGYYMCLVKMICDGK